MTKSAVVVASLLLSSCATHYQAAPNQQTNELVAGAILLVNEQPEVEPRVYFTDGITTVKTEYRGWTGFIATQLQKRIEPLSSSTAQGKTLGLSLQSITCSGHFVSDCSLSLLVSRHDGERKLYTTETFNGYPLQSALNKALDRVVDMVATDPAIMQYVSQ